MAPLKFIGNLRTQRRFSTLNQDQVEAMIDALTFAKVSDGQILPAEQKELKEGLKLLKWQGALMIEQYIDNAVQKASDVISDPTESQAYITTIAQRLDQDWMREEAYYMSALIAVSDQDLASSETNFLQMLVKAFELRPERLSFITQKIMKENTF